MIAASCIDERSNAACVMVDHGRRSRGTMKLVAELVDVALEDSAVQ